MKKYPLKDSNKDCTAKVFFTFDYEKNIFFSFFQLRLEYFIAVAVAVIVILILVLIVVAVLLVRVCKHRAIGSSSSFSDKITSVNGSMTALQSPYGAQVAGKYTANIATVH